jgi:hypothetical protein
LFYLSTFSRFAALPVLQFAQAGEIKCNLQGRQGPTEWRIDFDEEMIFRIVRRPN